MSETRDGGCQCGGVRYRIDEKPLELAVCHCTDCQRQSGSAFGMSLAVRAASFRLTKGELESFAVTCNSGRIKTCSFCGDCGTRIHHQTRPDVLSVKCGTLDDKADLRPSAHYWTKSKLPWVVIPPGVKSVADDG